MRLVRFLAPLALVSFLACGAQKAASPPRETTERIVTHRVESGETWASLAADFYGDEGRALALARDNGMDASSEPAAGSAVRIPLSGRDSRRVKSRLEAAREYNAGLDLVSSGNFAEAAQRFEEALKLDPSLHDASFNLAVAYEKLGFHAKAVSILEELVSVAPGDGRYRYALGASLFGAGNLEGAEKAFLSALAASPADAKAVFSLGVVLEKRGRTEEAKGRFRQYLSLDPDGPWAGEARARLEALDRSGGGGH
ncbi:MAG TPA: tetratricopeptide repeat protein [Candidatus Bathyarchaeia archaeon]|nr:tetratricopeptide repeat protein [Candidatus Bathyarchaeia archaeon]